MKIELWPIDKIIPYARNPRRISESAVSKLAGSIKEFGFKVPIIVDSEGVIIAGHSRLQAAQRLELKQVPVHVADDLTAVKAKAFRLAENRLHQDALWDDDLLKLELAELDDLSIDLELTGFDEGELQVLMAPIFGGDGNGEDETGQGEGQTGVGSLAARFGVPPFSVLNAREGWWQDRKRAWISLGIKSELGRGAPIGGGADAARSKGGGAIATPGGSLMPACDYSAKKRGDGRGRPIG